MPLWARKVFQVASRCDEIRAVSCRLFGGLSSGAVIKNVPAPKAALASRNQPTKALRLLAHLRYSNPLAFALSALEECFSSGARFDTRSAQRRFERRPRFLFPCDGSLDLRATRLGCRDLSFSGKPLFSSRLRAIELVELLFDA